MPQKISLTGKECIIAHLLNESQVRSFLEYCCTKANLKAKGDSRVKYHQKQTAPEASGFGGHQKLKDGGHIGVSTFPYLDRSEGFVMVSINLPQEVEGFHEIVKTGIKQFFGALEVIEKQPAK